MYGNWKNGKYSKTFKNTKCFSSLVLLMLKLEKLRKRYFDLILVERKRVREICRINEF